MLCKALYSLVKSSSSCFSLQLVYIAQLKLTVLRDQQPTFIVVSHVEEYRKIQYTPNDVQKVTQFWPRVARWLKLVSWKASWEPKQSLHEHARLQADIQDMEREESARRAWPASCDLVFSNLERQSFFDPEECQDTDLLATEPHLGKQISINTGQTINPDLDIHPTGRFTIAPAGSSIDIRTRLPMLSAVHDAEGQALSTITTERLGLLHASFKTQHQMPATVTTHSFEEAVAKLLHRYKEGRTSGKYTVNMRNYWTTPDSLVKVLTAGLSTNQERFASPLDFNPSFGSYYSPL